MALLAKDERPPVDAESQAPDQVQAHPIFAGGRFGLMSADSPRFPTKVDGGAKALEEHLTKQGLKYERTSGMYDGPEQSYIIHNPSREQMLKLGSDFGQESVIWGAGGNHEFHYTAGPQAGMFVQGHPMQGISYYEHRPSNFWTAMPNDTGFFRLNFDPEWKMRPGTELKADALVKEEDDTSFNFGANVPPGMHRPGWVAQHEDKKKLQAVQRLKGMNRQMAEIFLHYANGKTPERPAITPDLERHLGRHGIVDPAGFPFKENGQDMRRPLPGPKKVGRGEEPRDLNRFRLMNQGRDPGYVKAELAIVDLVKAEFAEQCGPHPHAYEWHDGHTDHHTGLLKADEHPHTSSFPKNDQAAKVGVETYAEHAAPYGTVTPGVKSNLLHYPLHGTADAAKQLVRAHGYEPYYAGGKYGKPDLARRNYNTKHLMIYDPSPDSGASFNDQGYTDSWRHMHELAHALTYPQLNQIYGEGRRIGKLGVHRNMREAQRAVHWEWLAAHKQRELAAQMGVQVPDDVFNKEVNTVMHDAVHRAVTGKFTEPSGEGFLPHAHKVPLETALGMIQSSGRNLGLQGPDDLLQRKSENMTTTNPLVDIRKAVLERLKKTEADLIELADREERATRTPKAPVDPIVAKVDLRLVKMAEHVRQDVANRMGFTPRWYREQNLHKAADEIGNNESKDYRSARDAALKKAFIDAENASYKTLHKGLADQHMEPGVHENAAPGAPSHAEPGGHEMAAMPTVDAPPMSPVGSSAASAGVPGGELAPPPISQPAPAAADPTAQMAGQSADLCPLCGNADVPGQCTCLPGQDQMAAPPSAPMAMAEGDANQPMAMSDKEPSSQPTQAGSLAMGEMCAKCSKAHGSDACKMVKADFIDGSGTKISTDTKGELPPSASEITQNGEMRRSPPVQATEPSAQGGLQVHVHVHKAEKDLVPQVGGAPKLPPGAAQPAEGTAMQPGKKAGKPVDPKVVASNKGNGNVNKAKKAEPPMAKPPSGKNPATMTPTASTGAPKVQGAPGGMAKAALPAAPKAQMAQHAQISGSKAAAPPAAGAKPGAMPSPTQQAGRAQAFGAAAAGAFQPKGPVVSGLDLAPKKPAGMAQPAGSIRQPTGPGPAQKSPFGKNEKCPFCKRSEHPGDCAP